MTKKTIMNPRHILTLAVTALLLVLGTTASHAQQVQTPLDKPLADFDKLVAQLNTDALVGEPIQIGEVTVIPLAKVSFGLGAGGATIAYGGGMGAKTVPVGFLVIQGETAHVEVFLQDEKGPSFLEGLFSAMKTLLPQHFVNIGNGVNLGGGSEADLKNALPIVSQMVVPGFTNFGNLINYGGSKHAGSPSASLEALTKLYQEKNYSEALSMAEALISKDPKNADLHVWKGRVSGSLAQGGPMDMIKYGTMAAQEFETAVSLDPNNPDAHLGRGVARLLAPPGFGGDLDGAVTDLEAAIAKKPSPEAYFVLGQAYQKKGANDKARASFKKALELKPDYSEASKALEGIK